MSDIFSLFKKIETGAVATGPVDFVVVGLGNPGSKYEGTRHNVGFAALDLLAKQQGFRLDRIRFKSLSGDCMLAGKRVLFLKPTTFMNLSGQAVVEAMQFYKLPPEQLLVLSDDVALAAGRLRVRQKGSDGGHNGLKNIIYLSGNDQFSRIKIGVGGKPHPEYDMADWVLSSPKGEDKVAIESAILRATEAIPLLVAGDLQKAMNLYNT